MLIKRYFRPRKNDLIYHYCSAETFHSICTNNTVRFSDLFSMNDFLEIHWGYQIWQKAANEIFDEVTEEFLNKVDEIISGSSLSFNFLASCFSLEGDVLSQWRAYADDGNGYCIGFDARHILGLPSTPLKVLYDEKKQIAEIIDILRKIYKFESEAKEDERYGKDFFEICALLSADLTSFKNPAFKEEKEVRLIHILTFEESNTYLKLVDKGGTYFGEDYDGQEVKFRMAKNLPIPYIDFNFINKNGDNPIKEVILGPKNDSRLTAIAVYLETLGIPNVKLRNSTASYR
ncbi:DUF2971 domain-containing protein [Flavobacterium sp. HJJ]|uniref:DUF2971 domain-containing protein n=1 Tax=Flavobacterium sp. HJJ TaxID=2783792 RepID=UPI00188AF16C|nr:DUF2971 domain-containing protein [Flavobacterium sp. HJJ]MBF4471085.1 DUF2971 domain-containing protein [Flavobacterium sp. HJJ]